MAFLLNGVSYDVLADAFTAAVDGNTIGIEGGTYDLTSTALTWNKRVNLVGLGASPLDVVLTHTSGVLFTIAASGTEDAPLTFGNFSTYNTAGSLFTLGILFTNTGDLTAPNYNEIVKYLRLTNINANRHSGVYINLRNVAGLEIDNCEFLDVQNAIKLGEYSTSQTYSGMVLSDIHVHDCYFHSSGNVLSSPTIYANWNAVYIVANRPLNANACSFTQLSNLLVEDNVFHGSPQKNVYIETGNNIVIRRNEFLQFGQCKTTTVNSRYPSAIEINLKWGKYVGIRVEDNLIHNFSEDRPDITDVSKYAIVAKARTDGTTYTTLVDGTSFLAKLDGVHITGNKIHDGPCGIAIGNGLNISPRPLEGSGILLYGTTVEPSPNNVNITNNEIDVVVKALFDARFGGTDTIKADMNLFNGGVVPSGGAQDAKYPARYADGAGAAVEGNNLAFWPVNGRFVKYRGAHSVLRDSRIS